MDTNADLIPARAAKPEAKHHRPPWAGHRRFARRIASGLSLQAPPRYHPSHASTPSHSVAVPAKTSVEKTMAVVACACSVS